jgi:hypothetical protein
MGTVLDMATETPLPTLPVIITDRSDRERQQRLTSRARRLTQLGLTWHALESAIAMLCAYLSGALLVGLLANALAGWWWADPAVALLIAAVALTEARDAWQGESCSCC